jgi:hypothetical protein
VARPLAGCRPTAAQPSAPSAASRGREAPRLLAADVGDATRIVADATRVYWASGRTLLAVDQEGGEPTPLRTAPAGDVVTLGDVVGGRLFWAEAPPVPLSEDTHQPEPREVELWALTRGPSARAERVGHITSRSTRFRIYAGPGGAPFVCTTGELGVGMYGESAKCWKLGEEQDVVAARTGPDDECVGWDLPIFVFTSLVVDGDQLYGVLWDDGDPGIRPLVRVSLADLCRKKPTVVEEPDVGAFAVDGDTLFALRSEACGSWSGAPCKHAPPELVAEDLRASPPKQRVIAKGAKGQELAVDARHAYWLEPAPAERPAKAGAVRRYRLLRVERSGEHGVVPVVEGGEGVVAFALHGSDLFWVAGGSLFRQPKDGPGR